MESSADREELLRRLLQSKKRVSEKDLNAQGLKDQLQKDSQSDREQNADGHSRHRKAQPNDNWNRRTNRSRSRSASRSRGRSRDDKYERGFHGKGKQETIQSRKSSYKTMVQIEESDQYLLKKPQELNQMLNTPITNENSSAYTTIQRSPVEDGEIGLDPEITSTRKGRWDSSDEDDEDEVESKPNPKSKNDKNESTPQGSVVEKLSSDIPIVEKNNINDTIEDKSDVVSNTNIDKNSDKSDETESVESTLEIKESTDSIAIITSDMENSNMDVDGKEPGQDLDNPIETITDAQVKKEHIPLFHGCRSVDVYQRVRYIDQGTYGMVYAARCKETGKMYALKQVKMGKETNRHGFPVTALRETNILLALNHPNIVQVREMVIGSSTDKVYMVMEYMDNDLKSCLEQLKQPLPISEVKQLSLQLLGAIQHMHDRWFIHRDLKTSNLLYSNEGKLAVCDFGMARKYGSPLLPYTFEVITLWYRPPELLLGERIYSTAVDMWSCGCILAELLLRKPLFPGQIRLAVIGGASTSYLTPRMYVQGEADQLSKIFKVLGTPTEHIWPGVTKLPHADKVLPKTGIVHRSKLRDMFPSTSFSGGIALSDSGFDLLNRLLSLDPKQRISATDAVAHPWFVENPLPTPQILMPKFKTTHES